MNGHSILRVGRYLWGLLKLVGNWSKSFRKVEEWVKRVVFPRHYLCPFDSRVQGSSPWVCLVCGQLRAWLRGTGYMSMVITGGKRGNRRGAATSWFKHPLPEPHDMALLTYLHFNRKRLEKLFRGPVAGGVLRVYWDGRVLIRVVGRYGSGTRHIYVKELDGSMPPGSTIEFTK